MRIKTLAADLLAAAAPLLPLPFFVLPLVAFPMTATAQTPAIPFLPLADEPPARLVVEPPVPTALARGAAIIPYRTENFRILPVFGAGALDVSPRAGHLHVTVDDAPWRWADAGDTHAVVVVGLPAGPHKVRLELALPDHQVIAGQTVSFTVPAVAGAAK